MDILQKVKNVANSLEHYDWADKNTNKNIFRLWQMFVECTFSSFLKRPVQVTSIELKIGSQDEFEQRTLENFCDVEFWENKEFGPIPSSYKPFQKLKDLMKSVTDKETDTSSGKPKSTVKSTVTTQQTKRGKRTSSKTVKVPEEVSTVREIEVLPSISDHLADKSDKNYTKTSSQKGTKEAAAVSELTPTRPYGTRRVRKRKKHFDEDEFEISWPSAAKKMFEVDEDSNQVEDPVIKVEPDYVIDEEQQIESESACYYACGQCSELRFSTEGEVCDHIKSKHKPEDNKEAKARAGCLHCDKSAVKNATYSEHIKKRHVKRKKTSISISCPKCPIIIQNDSKTAEQLQGMLEVICKHLLEFHSIDWDTKVASQTTLKKDVTADGTIDKNNVENTDDLEDLEDQPSADSTPAQSPKKAKPKSVKKAKPTSNKAGECPNCGIYLEGRSYHRHLQNCQKDPGVKTKANLLQLPNNLPMVACPLCEEDPPHFDKLHEIAEHIGMKHGECSTCPVCDLKWTKSLKGKSELQNQRAFATKVLMHFALSHDYLVEEKQTDGAADGAADAVQKENEIAATNEDITAFEGQSAEQIVMTLADNHVIEVAQTVIADGERASVSAPQDVNGQISFIDSDTLASGQQDLNQNSYTVQLIDGELDMNAVHGITASQDVQYIQYVDSDGTSAVTQVVYQDVDDSAENVTDANESVDYSTLQDACPNELIYTCFICPEKPRYVSKRTFHEHLNHLHIEQSDEDKDVCIMKCQDCEGFFTDADGKKLLMFESLAQHQMLHHRIPRPDCLEVHRCQTCQYETVCGTLFHRHFYHNRRCTNQNQEGTEEDSRKEYQCILCRIGKDKAEPWEKYVGEKGYEDHMKQEHIQIDAKDGVKAQCPICEKIYSSRNTKRKDLLRCIAFLTHHIWQAHDAEPPVQEKLIKCPLCATTTTEGMMYQRHVTVKHEYFREKMFKKQDENICESCSGLVNGDRWRSHQEKCSKIQKALTRKDKVICEICGVSVTYDHYIFSHRDVCASKTRNEDKTIKCDLCNKMFYTKIQMQEHFRRCHKQRETNLCNICKASLSGQQAYEEHMMTVHEINIAGKVLKECPICDFKGIVKTVKDHCKEVHGLNYRAYGKRKPLSKPTMYICEQCKYSTNKEAAFKSHLAHKHNIGRYDCKLCRYVGKSRSSYENHMKTLHPAGETNVHYCEVCQKQFSSMTSFDNHMFVKHGVNQSNRSVLHCDKCGFRTLGHSLLKLHMKMHIREVFTCELCKKEFNTKLSYTSHRRRHFKRMKCGECGLAVIDKTHLDRHIARVHRELVFKCDFCHYIAYTERLFSIHLQVRHKCSADFAKTLTENAMLVSRTRRRSRATANQRSSLVLAVSEVSGSSENSIDNLSVV